MIGNREGEIRSNQQRLSVRIMELDHFFWNAPDVRKEVIKLLGKYIIIPVKTVGLHFMLI